MRLRTSETDPLRIAEIAVGTGVIGVTLCPGKRGASTFGSAWARDLEADVAAIAAWGASAVVTLIEEHEFALLRVEGLPEAVRAAGIAWYHLPIEDVSVPDERFERAWPVVWSQLSTSLDAGERVLVHCRGGVTRLIVSLALRARLRRFNNRSRDCCGPAGTVAALMLIESGEMPEEAIQRVRAVRPGAIETSEQERWVLQRIRSQG